MYKYLDEISRIIVNALAVYDEAKESRTYMRNYDVFDQCQKTVKFIAQVSYMISNEEETTPGKAFNWASELPIPNGLFPKLINATIELNERKVPIMSFIFGLPIAIRYLNLVKDAFLELFSNIENRDENNEFTVLLQHWRNRI
ncbi:MAG: hypothetical protein ACFFDW_03775 [Candidatus Thorarchaeota archaeon]